MKNHSEWLKAAILISLLILSKDVMLCDLWKFSFFNYS